MRLGALPLLLLAACLEIGDPIYRGEPPPPVTLGIVDFAPAPGATDLPPGDPVVLVFDRDLEAGSAKVTLLTNGAPVSNVKASYHKGMVSLLPRGGFAAGAEHVLTVEAISGADGAQLGPPLELQFSTTGDANDTPRFDEIQAVWSGACALSGCHAGPRPQAGLDLSKGASRASAVDQDALGCGNVTCDFVCTGTCAAGDVPMKRVAPGLPCHSCMIKYLVEDYMPAARPREMKMPLDDATKDRIQRWILGGAPE